MANLRIGELETMNTDLQQQAQPIIDVEQSLRIKEVDLQQMREESLKLQAAMEAKDSVLKEKESQLQRTKSQVAGLEEAMKTLKQPNDPRRRLEVRLSEAIGKRKEKELELDRLMKARLCVSVCMCVEWYVVMVARRERGLRERIESGLKSWNSRRETWRVRGSERGKTGRQREMGTKWTSTSSSKRRHT